MMPGPRISVSCILFAGACAAALAQSPNTDPPTTPVNLLWIHHSTGANWSHRFDWDGSRAWNDGVQGVDHGEYATRHDTSGAGGNGEIALYNNNYILHHLSYGSQLGDSTTYTDYRDWYRKFRNWLDKNDSAHYVNSVGGADLVHCYSQDTTYASQGTDEFTHASVSSQTNQVIMFKSCFPNSAVTAADTSTGLPASPTAADARAWVATSAYSDWADSGNAGGPINYIKAEYLALLDIFGESRYRDLLFVAWVAPPEISSTDAGARTLAEWFEHDWLTGYAYNNVLLFNYYNIHTGEHTEGGDVLPAWQEKHNHARYNPFLGRRDYVGPGDPDFVNDLRMAFPLDGPGGGDSHPSHFAGAVAAKELIPLLNIQWNKLHNISHTGPTGYPTDQRTGYFPLDSSYTGTLPSGVTHATVDGVSCLSFNGNGAVLDLGPVTVLGSGGAFSYSFWYRPNDSSIAAGDHTTLLRKEGVFQVDHFAQDPVDSHINTLFGGDYPVEPDHYNNVVDSETWTHVTFTFDGAHVRNYVDGVQIMDTASETRPALEDNSNHLTIGGGDGSVAGAIREVAIYSRALSADEVRRIFNANAAVPATFNGWMMK